MRHSENRTIMGVTNVNKITSNRKKKMHLHDKPLRMLISTMNPPLPPRKNPYHESTLCLRNALTDASPFQKIALHLLFFLTAPLYCTFRPRGHSSRATIQRAKTAKSQSRARKRVYTSKSTIATSKRHRAHQSPRDSISLLGAAHRT